MSIINVAQQINSGPNLVPPPCVAASAMLSARAVRVRIRCERAKLIKHSGDTATGQGRPCRRRSPQSSLAFTHCVRSPMITLLPARSPPPPPPSARSQAPKAHKRASDGPAALHWALPTAPLPRGAGPAAGRAARGDALGNHAKQPMHLPLGPIPPVPRGLQPARQGSPPRPPRRDGGAGEPPQCQAGREQRRERRAGGARAAAALSLWRSLHSSPPLPQAPPSGRPGFLSLRRRRASCSAGGGAHSRAAHAARRALGAEERGRVPQGRRESRRPSATPTFSGLSHISLLPSPPPLSRAAAAAFAPAARRGGGVGALCRPQPAHAPRPGGAGEARPRLPKEGTKAVVE